MGGGGQEGGIILKGGYIPSANYDYCLYFYYFY